MIENLNKFSHDELAYNVNHDTLMSLHAKNRSKLIAFFIASNTPNKIDPIDRQNIQNRIMGIKKNANYVGLSFFTFSFLFAKAFRPLLSSLAIGSALGFFSRRIFFNELEYKLIFNSTIMDVLAEKYSFTVFDFHNSKRESQLSRLVQEMGKESNNVMNTATSY